MDFELVPWPVLPHDAILKDDLTEQQAQIERQRAQRGSLSPAQLMARRRSLSERFGGSVSPSFFVEIFPEDRAQEAQLIAERRLRLEMASAAMRELQEGVGAALVDYPVDRKWSGWGCWSSVVLTKIESLRVKSDARRKKVMKPGYRQTTN